MDNSLTHPNSQLQSDDEKIMCHFLTANTTALIQLMDQGVIESMKRRYRKQFIQQLVTFSEEINVKDFWKRYTIKDTVFNISQTWNGFT
ncbi:DDE superfamily endonuclease domain [Cinara cedri]|uniref:DDE superfamily endonuclease domain n=1 Tax=Cinara cedri TaxID=506608 RepID=A0A5E4NQH2_9HEMI|nr:DDE superfamily endonuclease domain [Cinara cedri]